MMSVEMTAPRLDAFVAERSIVAFDRALCALDVELGAADGGDVTLAEGRLASIAPLHPDREVVDVRRVVPHPVGGAAEDPGG